MADILLDTTIAIDASNDNPRALAYVNSLLLANTACLHAQVVAEAIEGVRNLTELRKLRKFTSAFPILFPSEQISRHALDFLQAFHLSHEIGYADYCIGSTALRLGLTVATLNVKDFMTIHNLKVIRPY